MTIKLKLLKNAGKGFCKYSWNTRTGYGLISIPVADLSNPPDEISIQVDDNKGVDKDSKIVENNA